MTDRGGFDAEKEAWSLDGVPCPHVDQARAWGTAWADECNACRKDQLQRAYAAGIEAAAAAIRLPKREEPDFEPGEWNQEAVDLLQHVREKQIRALLPSGKEPGR